MDPPIMATMEAMSLGKGIMDHGKSSKACSLLLDGTGLTSTRALDSWAEEIHPLHPWKCSIVTLFSNRYYTI